MFVVDLFTKAEEGKMSGGELTCDLKIIYSDRKLI